MNIKKQRLLTSDCFVPSGEYLDKKCIAKSTISDRWNYNPEKQQRFAQMICL